MNRNIRASYLSVKTPTNDFGLIVRDFDLVDNDFLLQIDAIGFGHQDLRGLEKYEHPTIQYRVRLEQLATKLSPKTVTEFMLASCPCTRLNEIPLWLASIPVEVLSAYDNIGAIHSLMTMIFSHCVGAGRHSLAMTLLETGWVQLNGTHTFDAQHYEDKEVVRVQFEVRRNLVRYKRTTLVSQLTPNKRLTEIVPFAQVWPHLAAVSVTPVEELLTEVRRMATIEPGHYYTVEQEDLSRCTPVSNAFKIALSKLHWDGSVDSLLRLLQQHDVRCEKIDIGPYEAIHCGNAVIYFSELGNK